VSDRVELQAEVDAPRELVYPLLATADGLARWMDEAELDPRVGGRLRVRLRGAVAVGAVLSLQPIQHISFTWDWEERPLDRVSVVAFDAIDHGKRTHVTFRHVGLPTPEQVALHEEMWRYWMRRFVLAVRDTAAPEIGASTSR
jgi:uncharacterized protein YndB with AHSA1/START domain